jgi:outer membrane protein assembly factor BamB
MEIHDWLVCRINSDGNLKWMFTTGGNIEESSPAIGSDGTIYVGSEDNKLYAINPDGSQKWNFTTGGEVRSSPAIDSDGTIYIGSFDDSKLYAINPDGTQKWNYTTGGGVRSSPAIDFNNTIYIGSRDGKLHAINLDGTQKWSYTTSGYVNSSPAIGSDGTIYVGSLDIDPTFHAINQDGTKKWSFNTGSGVYSSPAIGADGTIYFGSHPCLYAVNPDGNEKWNFTTGTSISSSPAIGSEGTIYVGSQDNKIYAINPDGTQKWNFTTERSILSSAAIGSDGTVYIGSRDYNLYAIGTPHSFNVKVTSHFTTLNSAAQSTITAHVTDGTNPVQGATVNLVSDNGGIFSPQSGITDANGDFKSIFNAPTVTTQIICRISAEVSKNGYNDGSGYVDVTINPIPWPMFRQNLNHTGVSPYDTSSNPGKLKWSFTTGNGILSSPTIGFNGTIYIGSQDNKLYAVNPNGTQKWNFTTGHYVRSSSAISFDGTIYVGSTDRKLYAINPDGTEKWNFTTGDAVESSPIIGSDGTIYVGSFDNNLYAINPDGTEKWSFTTGNWVPSSPAIGSDGIIYVGSWDKKLYAINPDGTEKWSFETGDGIWSSPVIDSHGSIYIGSTNYKLYSINPDGTEKWNFTTTYIISSSPAIGSDGTIYIGSYDCKLYAINPDGTEKWNFTTEDSIDSSPSIGSDGIIYVGSWDNKLYAINPNGIEKWNFTAGYHVHSSPAIDYDGTIYVGSGDKKLYAIGGFIPNIVVEKTANVTVANPGDLIEYTIYYNNTAEDVIYESGQEQLTFEDNRQFGPRFHPDGSKIVYSATEDDGFYRDIWIMDADGKNHVQLTSENYRQHYPSFSPDGSKIIYSSEEEGFGYEDIWIMNSDGSDHQQLTFEDEEQCNPKFSPDESKIVYTGSEDGGFYKDIWIMDADGSNHVQLTSENYRQQFPSFSPDGSKIIYSSEEDGGGYEDIWIMNSDGSDHQQLTMENNRQFGPHFNPDGSRIVYTATEDGGSYRDIWIMDADGSNHEQLTFENFRQQYPSFSPDGNKIVYSSEEDGLGYEDIWLFNLETKRDQAKNVWINDTLPEGVTFVTSSAEAERSGDYNWTFYDVEPGEHNFTITVEVNSSVQNGTILTNHVHLDCTDSLGNLMVNSSDSVEVMVLASEDQPPIANAGPNQTVNEGDVVQFDGTGSTGSGAQDYWDSFMFGADSFITSAPSDTILATFDYSGTVYPALVAAGYGNGRAVYAEGSTFSQLANLVDPGNVHHQLFVNSVKWSTKGKDPAASNILVVWGHREILTYGTSAPGVEDSNATRALEDEGYNVFTSHDVPSSLAGYDAVIIPGIGWSWGGWVNPDLWSGPGGTNTAHKPTTAEVTTLLSFINNGGGLVASVEYGYGADWLQDVGNPMGVYFDAITWASPYTGHRIVDHPIFLKWDGDSTEIISYEWDFESDGIYDYQETSAFALDGTFDGKTTHTYGDDGVFVATLRVTDNNNLSATDICNVTVQNVDPTVTIESITMEVEIGLRVAGRKYNNVSMTLYEEGSSIGYVSIERLPGSPNEQMAWIPVSINFSRSYNATVTYTPKDPPNVGANPVWIYIKSKDGTINRIHHTFNVQQSKKRNSGHWNHVEPWEVDLNGHFIGLPFEITSHITDPGSDDEILTYTYGSQVKTITYLNNPLNPDPYPSPEVNPRDIIDTTTLIYEGPGTVTLVVKNDDNVRLGVGEGTDYFSVG